MNCNFIFIDPYFSSVQTFPSSHEWERKRKKRYKKKYFVNKEDEEEKKLKKVRYKLNEEEEFDDNLPATLAIINSDQLPAAT